MRTLLGHFRPGGVGAGVDPLGEGTYKHCFFAV